MLSPMRTISFTSPQSHFYLPPIARLSNNFVKRKLVDGSPYAQSFKPAQINQSDPELIYYLKTQNIQLFKQHFTNNELNVNQLMKDLFVEGPFFKKDLFNPGLVHKVDTSGKTALFYATAGEADLNNPFINVKLVQRLKRKQDHRGQTALMLAAQLGLEKQINALIDEVGMKDHMGQTAIMHAIMHRKINAVQILMKHEQQFVDAEGTTVHEYLDMYKIRQIVERGLK
ncbi:Conserved_hypothetical protein [Hexamita inflata]|uniref:Uncharacterized protein n=1 Tax=Hexamita inflata TaxID=28002 RepID=A0AA86PIP1_9EUKA|nr:Conserved hypothetical protein [Hexamita inflata]